MHLDLAPRFHLMFVESRTLRLLQHRAILIFHINLKIIIFVTLDTPRYMNCHCLICYCFCLADQQCEV